MASTGPFIVGKSERAKAWCLVLTNVWVTWKLTPLPLLPSRRGRFAPDCLLVCALLWAWRQFLCRSPRHHRGLLLRGLRFYVIPSLFAEHGALALRNVAGARRWNFLPFLCIGLQRPGHINSERILWKSAGSVDGPNLLIVVWGFSLFVCLFL